MTDLNHKVAPIAGSLAGATMFGAWTGMNLHVANRFASESRGALAEAAVREAERIAHPSKGFMYNMGPSLLRELAAKSATKALNNRVLAGVTGIIAGAALITAGYFAVKAFQD